MVLLGIDCANKSFAVCAVKHNTNWKKEQTAIYDNFMKSRKTVDDFIETFKKLNSLYDTVFDILSIDVFDLIPEKKLKESSLKERSLGLKKTLQKVCDKFPDVEMTLIEYQMSSNDKSRSVFYNTYYHFVDKCDTFKVGPSRKNTIAFDKTLRHSKFCEKYTTSYTANKNHAKENLKYWLKLFNKEHILSKIGKKNHDDAADAFLTVVGFMVA